MPTRLISQTSILPLQKCLSQWHFEVAELAASGGVGDMEMDSIRLLPYGYIASIPHALSLDTSLFDTLLQSLNYSVLY
jgi:hypothetical protein